MQPTKTNTLGGTGDIFGLTTMKSTIWAGGNGTSDLLTGGRFDGLAAGQYDILLWGNNGNTGDSPMLFRVAAATTAATFDFTGSTSGVASNVPPPSDAWSDGTSYSSFTVTVAAGESLYFSADGNTVAQERGFLSGVQLIAVAVPEPTTLALLASGGLCLLLLRRRRRKEKR